MLTAFMIATFTPFTWASTTSAATITPLPTNPSADASFAINSALKKKVTSVHDTFSATAWIGNIMNEPNNDPLESVTISADFVLTWPDNDWHAGFGHDHTYHMRQAAAEGTTEWIDFGTSLTVCVRPIILSRPECEPTVSVCGRPHRSLLFPGR